MQAKSKSALSAKSVLRKQQQLSRKLIFIEIIFLVFITGLLLYKKINFGNTSQPISKFASILNKKLSTPIPSPSPTPSPTPTPRPLTFSEMNSLYGPCVRMPVLMYHHIQSQEAAKANKQTALTVYTNIFQEQMSYLKAKNYNVVSVSDLVNFFDGGASVPSKSILLTFDDGYKDFYTDAFPILSGLGFKATVFVPTGLLENPSYLSWAEISQMKSNIFFGNHTWSHKSVLTQASTMQKEISTADSQLSERGLNSPKTFAYPYGPNNVQSENYLNSLGYKTAFTTINGSILCKKQRFSLPRIRVGNNSLSYYGI